MRGWLSPAFGATGARGQERSLQVALLSTLEPSSDDPSTPRGLLRLGGRSIAQDQLGAAMALGCERVICLADGLSGDVIALQHAAERAGANFQVAGDGHAVARLLRPEDELLVITDGLVAAPDEIEDVLGDRFGLVVQPAQTGTAAGFERVDPERASAGVLRLPGRMAAALAELPSEWNPVSALLRIAAQAGLRQVELPRRLAQAGQWTLVRSEAEADRLEPRWLRLHIAGAATGGPGAWLAARAVERLGPTLLHAGTRPATIGVGAAILVLFALGFGWLGVFSVGFVLLAMAWLVRRAGTILERIDRNTVCPLRKRVRSETIFDWAIDATFVVLATWRYLAEAGPSPSLAVAAFVAVVPFGLLRLIPAVFRGRRWSPWFADRLVVGAALVAASLSAVFGPALMVAGLVLLAFALVAAHVAPSASEAERPTT